MIDDTGIAALIMANMKPEWQKVAMVIARVSLSASEDSEDFLDKVAQKIVDLVNEGKLMSQGNLADWRHSEICRA